MGAARGAAADDDEGAAIKGGNRSFPYPHGLKASGNIIIGDIYGGKALSSRLDWADSHL